MQKRQGRKAREEYVESLDKTEDCSCGYVSPFSLFTAWPLRLQVHTLIFCLSPMTPEVTLNQFCDFCRIQKYTQSLIIQSKVAPTVALCPPASRGRQRHCLLVDFHHWFASQLNREGLSILIIGDSTGFLENQPICFSLQ